MPFIELIDVEKRFGKGRKESIAVYSLSYSIEQGEFVSLLGPSGCGKSTTLNMVAGLEDVSDGSILIEGKPVQDLEPDKRDLAFVFQDYALYPHMDVYDNIAFGLKMRKFPADEIRRRVTDAAQRLEIEHVLDRRPRQLSGGQRQRVALGRAIARRPSVFLFDEPLSNLDALLRDQTRTLIKQLHSELGATSVYVTHDQEEAMTLSDRIVVMSRGRLEQLGTPMEIYHHPATQFVAGFVGKPKMNLVRAGRVERGRYRIEDTHLDIDVPDVDAEQIQLGLRPEECGLRPADDGNATVSMIEPLGNVTDVHVDAGGKELCVRVPGFPAVETGQLVMVDVTRARKHCFDIESGRRL